MSIQMSPAKYWEWRTSIEELQHEELKLKYITRQLQIMEKDIEIAKLSAMIYKIQYMKDAQNKYADVKKGYDKFKLDLEKELGVDLNNKVIDEFTYEIRDLNEVKE